MINIIGGMGGALPQSHAKMASSRGVFDAVNMALEDDSDGESDLQDSNGMEFSEEDDDDDDNHELEIAQGTSGRDGEMIESYDKRELILHSIQDTLDDDVSDPYEGMEFDSGEDAMAFYNAYASRSGFQVRVSRCHCLMRDGAIIYRQFVCSREGFGVQKNQVRSNSQRKLTRVGCMAMLVVKKQNPSGKWLVTKFVKEHNHKLVAPRKVHLKPRMVRQVNKVENCTAGEETPLAPERGLIAATFPLKVYSESEPYEGMEFQSEEAARTFYYAYAKNMGFTVRISKCRRARDGLIICRRFVCSKEGYYVRKFGSTKRSRALTRVGCLARLIVKKLDSGSWVVANFDKEHNHPPFVVGNELNYQPPEPVRRVCHGIRASLPLPDPNRNEVEIHNSHNSTTWRFDKLHQEGIKFAEEGALSVEIFNVAMLALREATQKVVSAKKSTSMASQFGNLAGDTNGDNANGTSSFQTQTTLSNQQCSSEGRNAASNGVILLQQPLNLVLIAPNELGQPPLAIKLTNNQPIQDMPEKQQLSFTAPASVYNKLSASAHRLDGNGLVGSGMSAERKMDHRTAEDDLLAFITVQDFGEGDSKEDGAATQSQEWNVLGVGQLDLHAAGGDNPTSVTLSEAQVAALQAVAEAFNVPTMGATSSSALPLRVLPVSDESEGNKGCCTSLRSSPPISQSLEMFLPHQRQQHPHEARRTPGQNPLHVTAIAAGARIASPAVAASLIKAVQSRTAAHFRSGGGCSSPPMPKFSPPAAGANVCAAECLTTLGGGHQNHQGASNTHYFETGELSTRSLDVGVVQGSHPAMLSVTTGTHQAAATLVDTIDSNGLQSALMSDQTYFSNAPSEEQVQALYHSMIQEPTL